MPEANVEKFRFEIQKQCQSERLDRRDRRR
jgi:hypothetical protein